MMRMCCIAVAFLCCCDVRSQVAKRFDVVIHEILPDPAPAVALPNSEFIELRNTSSTAFNLRNWKLSDGSSTATISISYILPADSCVIICPASALPAYAAFGAAIGVTAFPSLNNDADIIWLISPEGNIIHSVAYEPGWHRNAVKSEGGWSLEMIDRHNPCGAAGNWIASSHTSGGTPGKRNSAEDVNPDVQPPALTRTYTIDSITIVAVFDEPLDSFNATATDRFLLDKDASVIRAIPLAPLFREVKLTMASALLAGNVYLLTAAGITDCAGNSIGAMNIAKAGLPSPAVKGNIIINEVLFNPRPAGTDYIELYNRGDAIIDASGLYLSNDMNSTYRVSETPFLIFPGDHILVTADAALVQRQYVTRHPQNILPASLPSLPDDKGRVILLDQHGVVIEELLYDEKWHFALIANPDGVALERIDGAISAQGRDNWTSATSDAGYGTPTSRNSQYRSSPSLKGKIEVSPLFSPDNNGRDDLCFISYQLPEPGKVASILIFDLNGNLVKTLQRNATLSGQGSFKWDGLDDKGRMLPMGVYIVFTELFDLNGNRKNFKNTVTLAHGF